MRIAHSLFLAAAFMSAAPLLAEELRVTDCTGAVRAAGVVEAGSLSQVVVTIKARAGDLPSVVELSLVADDGTSADAKAVAGKAVFREISAGTWKSCTANGAFSIEQVSIITKNTSGFYASEVVLGGAGAAGLTAAAGLSLGGGGSSESDSTLLSGSPGGSIPNKPILNTEQQYVTAAAASQAGDRREACMTGEKPAPLSPFL